MSKSLCNENNGVCPNTVRNVFHEAEFNSRKKTGHQQNEQNKEICIRKSVSKKTMEF